MMNLELSNHSYLEFMNIGKYFKSEHNTENMQVLDDLSLEIRKNEFISLIGPSGCGKTTFLRIAAGFDNKFKGTIKSSIGFIKGTGENNKNPLLGRVGYIPQQESLFDWLTAGDNIKYGLNIKKVPGDEQNRIVDELLKLVDLSDYKDYYPKELSGGMKQKIIICRAIAVQPELNILLLDEPFSALDSQARNRIQGDLLKIWQEKKATIVFITHNIDEALFMSDRVAIMTKKPAKIKEIIEIDLPRPRDRTSVEFNSIRRCILTLLSEEV
jgi:NitT/TauT family transport system ATP-binding protein